MSSVDWLKEIKLQKRDSEDHFWEDLDLVVFEPTDDGQVHLSYFAGKDDLKNETKMVKELLNAEFGLRIVERG